MNKMIDNFVSPHKKIWTTTTHETKLIRLRLHQNPPTTHPNMPKPIVESVKNVSNRTLTIDELHALSNGLDYVYSSRLEIIIELNTY
jgi:hypothetical protein